MRVLIFGAKGMLGTELVLQLRAHGHQVDAFDREVDITDSAQVSSKIEEIKPNLIFNCAAYNAVDKAEEQPELANKLNADAVGFVATAAKKAGAIVVHYSTGFVFDGSSQKGYNEDDQPNPQSVYARSKYQGEVNLRQNTDKYYLIRLNLLFGNSGTGEASKMSFPEQILQLSQTKDSFDFVNDETSTPTYAPDLVKASMALVEEKYPFGIYHLVNSGTATWFEWAQEIFRLKNISAKINPVSAEKFPRAASRPKNSVLINNKSPALRSWQDATKEFLQ